MTVRRHAEIEPAAGCPGVVSPGRRRRGMARNQPNHRCSVCRQWFKWIGDILAPCLCGNDRVMRARIQEALEMASESGSIWDRLARPFRSDEVKTRPQGGRKLPFVTARTVMNRLDEVIGPENWWDSYLPIGDAVLCTLTIRLPDGREISKQDAGGKAGMPDSGDDEKSGVSDAFKRAAVKFGVGRYLYGDGTPRHQIDDSTTQRAEPRPDPAPATPRPTAPARPLSAEEKRLRDEFPERCPVVTGKELYGFLRDHKLTDAAAQLEGYPPKIVHWSNAEVADAWPAIRAAGLGK